MNKLFFILLICIISLPAYAATSANYAISVEVIDLGGASMESTTYNMIGKLRELEPVLSTSASYTLEGRFLGIVSATAVNTFEPVITAVIPPSAYNTMEVFLKVTGTNISTDATVSLLRFGQTDINGITGTYTYESGTSVSASFEITGAQTGLWNVRVTNVGWGNASRTKVNAFTVLSAGPVRIIGTPFNTPNPFNPADGSTHIIYNLSSSTGITLYLFNQLGELIWQKTYAAGTNGGSGGNNDILWDGVTDFREDVPTGVYLLKIVMKSGGARELGRIKIAVLRQ